MKEGRQRWDINTIHQAQWMNSSVDEICTFANTMQNRNYTTVFFDLDRTLWDFDHSASMAFEDIFSKYRLADLNIPSVEVFLKAYHIHNEKLWAQYRLGEITKEKLRGLRFLLTLNSFGIDDGHLAEAIGHEYVRLSPLKVSLFPFAIEILKYLKPLYKLHLITNGFNEVQTIKLESSGLGKYFDQVITSEEAGSKKPDRGIFEFAIKKTGAVVHESIMVGDDPEVDIQGASNFGMDSVLFDPVKKFAKNGSTHYINSLSELYEIL